MTSQRNSEMPYMYGTLRDNAEQGVLAPESQVTRMVVEHLQRALEHLDELTPDEQEDVAEQILAYVGRTEPRGARARRLAGAWADLPGDMEETMLRWRRETPPTPPIEDLPGEHEDLDA